VTITLPDTTPPSTTISTADPSATRTSSLAITGTCTDSGGSGVASAKYRIDAAPDATHGSALSGTTSWSGTVVGLSVGANTVYVSCGDNATPANWGGIGTGADSMIINYVPPRNSKNVGGFNAVIW
jgi:hypothetical protein